METKLYSNQTYTMVLRRFFSYTVIIEELHKGKVNLRVTKIKIRNEKKRNFYE